MAKQLLSSSSSSSSSSDVEDDGFTINPTFAAAYEAKKKTEELSKLKDKYGVDARLSDGDESSSEEELSTDDEDAELLTPAVDLAVLRTLKRIREGKDVEEGRNVFEEEEKELTSRLPTKSDKSNKNEKPLKLKEYKIQNMLRSHGARDSSNEADDSSAPLTNVQASARLHEETKRAFHQEGGDDDDDDFLIKKTKGKRKEEESDEEFQKTVAETLGLKDGEVQEGIKRIAGGDDGDDFLAAYVLNRGWMDKKKKKKKVSSYSEIIGVPDSGGAKDGFDQELADGDSEFEDRVDEFESKYNFRFEEAEGTSLATHARETELSLRQPSAHTLARKRQREAKEERKKEREAELRRMQDLQKEERKKKLNKVKEEGGRGLREEVLELLDLEKEFSEGEHERIMEKMYGEEFYGAVDDDGKPTWEDDIDIDDILAQAPPEVGKDGDEDEAYDPSNPGPKDKKGKRAKQNKRRKEKKREKTGEGEEDDQDEGEEEDPFAHLVVDPTKKFEYATTDVRDVDLDLTPAEILLATDVELNELIALKKLAPYRSLDGEHNRTKKKYQWRLKDLKTKLERRKWGKEFDPKEDEREARAAKRKREDGEEGREKKKRKGKKEREKKKAKEGLLQE